MRPASEFSADGRRAQPGYEVGARSVLIVDSDSDRRQSLQVMLGVRGWSTDAVPAVDSAADLLAGSPYACVLCEAPAVRRFAEAGATAVLALVARDDRAGPTVAREAGAYDVIPVPAEEAALTHAVERALERYRLVDELTSLRAASSPTTDPMAPTSGGSMSMIGDSPPMRALAVQIDRIAAVDASVLVCGESGTGKELVARALHDRSRRRQRPFVAVNCAAIPAALLESELFGHVRGSFTDAVRDKAGLFEQADGGTLFLDEIGELPHALQAKLLRALQEREIRPVGASEVIAVDARIVAATVRDLEAEVAAGRFREDLYYRLNVVGLRLPPLRDRPGDIPALVNHFIERCRKKHAAAGLDATGVTDEAMDILCSYAWPGNIRELENTIERALVLCEGKAIDRRALGDRLARAPSQAPAASLAEGELSIKKTVRAVERDLIVRALKATGGNRTSAARLLEISHRALLYKIKEYGL